MPYIFLDRDGVINIDTVLYIKSPEQWSPLPHSLEAMVKLHLHGYQIIIITNQSGLARQFFDEKTLLAIHHKMETALSALGGKITDIFYCPHHPYDHCACRKPKPGMFLQARDKYGIDLSTTYFVGDNHSDVIAAQNAGCKPLLVLTGKGADVLKKYPELTVIPHFPDLSHAVNYLCEG
jgi:D-glycero-D-manno-heptose 1,7-bisphosphate phosphatase